MTSTPIDLGDYCDRVKALPEPTRERAEAALERVITAHMLSYGPCEARSIVWRPKLARRREALERILNRHGDARIRS